MEWALTNSCVVFFFVVFSVLLGFVFSCPFDFVIVCCLVLSLLGNGFGFV
jgi:hypothetical protein